MSLTFDLHRNPTPASDERRAAIHANPGFGVFFTDHMVRAVWTKAGGWGDGRVEPYGPIQLMPSAAVLHYAQEIFEGLKAYRHADGSVWSFRPEANAERMQRSARRLALPELPTDDFVASLRALRRGRRARGCRRPAPARPACTCGRSCSPREAFLGVRPANEVTYCLIASPGRGLLRRRPEAGDPVDLAALRPRRRRWHRRRQDRRQLRVLPRRASSRASSTAATRPSSSTPRPRPTSRSSGG